MKPGSQDKIYENIQYFRYPPCRHLDMVPGVREEGLKR